MLGDGGGTLDAKFVSAELRSLDPRLVEVALDLYLNLLSRNHEEPYSYTAERFTHDDHRISEAIERSCSATGSLMRFRDVEYGPDYILSGFECVAQDSPFEIGLIAWSTESDPDVFRCLSATKGTHGAVALPAARVLPVLLARAEANVRTRVLVVHNHPRNAFKEMVEKFVGVPLGPSGTDRSTMFTWAVELWVKGRFVIEPEFFLYEQGEWRRIRWPAAAQLLAWMKEYGPLVADAINKKPVK